MRWWGAALLLAGACTAAGTGPDARWNLDPEEARRAVTRVEPGRDLTPAAWPGGKRVAVALTFDFDAEVVWGHPGRVSLSSLSRGRYGARAGLPRVLEVLSRRGFSATFFLTALVVSLYPDEVEAIGARGHEIGYHGYAHESVRTLTPEQERDTFARGLAIFRAAGLMPRGHRSGSFDFTAATPGLLREFGFVYDSSLMADDRPYELLAGGRPTGLVELPVDWSLDDWPHFQLEWATPWPGLRAPSEVYEIWREEYEGVRADGGTFVLTLHPQVIGRWSRLRMLERLLDHIEEGGDAWVATLGEIADHVREEAR